MEEEVHRNVRRFFELQAKVDELYFYINHISDIVQEMTLSLEDFRRYYPYIDFIEVEGFYKRLAKKCNQISESIFKMLLEMKKERVRRGEW